MHHQGAAACQCRMAMELRLLAVIDHRLMAALSLSHDWRGASIVSHRAGHFCSFGGCRVLVTFTRRDVSLLLGIPDRGASIPMNSTNALGDLFHTHFSNKKEHTRSRIEEFLKVSLAARQLRHGLLNRDPVNRLGSKTGANEIKQHSFFCEMNWPLIHCMTLPELEVPLQVTGREPDSKVKDAQWADEQMPIDSLQNL
ncbi:hypothetical protein ZIOFF_032183 [Zingiber officinale]|uniref:non-specific serine/threonine protein kinase n=1 Tax=Zingiber officinale TaxID=94328 RepID=A0A8J5GIN3_ZINOF|nr:hypothetical protein ZIOFF_032183 [Zingiber officinale]